MFDDVLIESVGQDRKKGGWIAALISAVIHIGVGGALVYVGLYVEDNPRVIEKPMSAFVVASAPPPPPPPPPAANPGGARAKVPRVETQEQPRERFRQPTEIPREMPEVDDVASEEVTGAVPGGVVGGVKGGQIGGAVGGEIGGVDGGTPGGKIGGQIGGTGDTPVRVGGNVKAPIAVLRPNPVYTEAARRARIQGIVIIEAVIDRQGYVTEARVLKSLPMGLDQAALNAVKQWKFKPGTLNGQPVPVYYNLTVHFQLN